MDAEELAEFLECTIVSVDRKTALRAQSVITSCESCKPDDADIPFDWVLAEVTGKEGMYEFIMEGPVPCPFCHEPVTEWTFVEWGGVEVGVL